VIGYEVAVRIAEARVSATVDSVATGRWGCYGAAAAGGRLKRLSADRIAHALAIAGMQAPSLPPPAPGHVSTSGHLVKEGIPWSTLTGLAALELAERGFTGRTAVLDHPSHFDARRLVHGLGATWAIEQVYFKPYSCCRWLHAALDAFLSLRDEHGLRAFEIEGVSVDTFGMVLTLSNHVAPASLEAAQFSTPFCIAVAAHEGASGLLPLRPELLGRSDLIDLARKVTLRADPDIDKRFPGQRSARVIVEARGTTFERTVTQPLGDPANPMTPSQIRAKFSTLSAGHWSAEDQEKVVAAVESMHRQEGWRSLERLLTADRIGSRS
jgi:2-methylcitrate dehydratase PrpD